MKRNPNYITVIDVPFWSMEEAIFFKKMVRGNRLVDNVVYVMDWFKNYEHGLNSPKEKVLVGKDKQGFLHVGTNYPKNITRQNDIDYLKNQNYRGIAIHTMDIVSSVRALDTLLTVLLRDKIVSRENISEQKVGEFDHIYKRLEQAA